MGFKQDVIGGFGSFVEGVGERVADFFEEARTDILRNRVSVPPSEELTQPGGIEDIFRGVQAWGERIVKFANRQ